MSNPKPIILKKNKYHIRKRTSTKNLNKPHLYRTYEYEGHQYSYRYVHVWIKENYGKANKCENTLCKKKSKTYEWSNISNNYELNRNDWQMLCHQCHRLYDIDHHINKANLHNRLTDWSYLSKPVSIFSIDGQLIETYPSIAAAARSKKVNTNTIRHYINRDTKLNTDTIWKYTNKSS